MRRFLKSHLVYVCLLLISIGTTQGQAPVKWEFRVNSAAGNEAVITLSAKISPGWHLYSQYLAEGLSRLRYES